jgi:DNA-binding transcriptional LysR family regulator
MINFLNLEYFLVAAEELNFTRAAKRLYISQQSLSNHISNLEKELITTDRQELLEILKRQDKKVG